jgi:hypothetical protein
MRDTYRTEFQSEEGGLGYLAAFLIGQCSGWEFHVLSRNDGLKFYFAVTKLLAYND